MLQFSGVTKTPPSRHDELDEVLTSTTTQKSELVAKTSYTCYDKLDKVLMSTNAQKFGLDQDVYGKCLTYPVLHNGVSEILILLWHHFRCVPINYYNG